MLPTLFNYEGKQLRTVIKDGEVWFVAKDVCDILEITNSRDAVARLDEDEKGVVSTDTLGGAQEVQAANEYGLYSLVLTSRKPEAKQFKRWITHEVIPSIRKTGTYSVQPEDSYMIDNPIERAKRWIEEQTEKQLLETKLEEQRPKVIFAEALEVSNSSILIGELAKILRQNGIDIGQNRLFEKLRDEGYLMKRGEAYNQPTQTSMDLGLLEIKKRTINNPDGSIRVTSTPKITSKGQIYFVNKFKAEQERNVG